MRAETYFSFSDYAQATSAWEKVNFSKLPEKLKGPSYFKSGWSLVENGDYNSAINVLSEFISRYPESPDLMAAVAKRAESYLEVGDRISALSDFERVLEAKPKTPLAAFALHSLADSIVWRDATRKCSRAIRRSSLITTTSAKTLSLALITTWGSATLTKVSSRPRSFT